MSSLDSVIPWVAPSLYRTLPSLPATIGLTTQRRCYMRRIFLAAALFGVMSGLAGAMAYGWLREGADAAPPLVAREDELSIIAGGFVEVSNPVDGAWHDVRDVSYA